MSAPNVEVPDGHVIVPAPGSRKLVAHVGTREDGTVAPEEALRVIAANPDAVRVIPAAWLAEREAMQQRHWDEERAFEQRILDAPRYEVTVTLKVRA